MAALQACETSRLGPPSRIADPGLFLAIFQVGAFPEELCVVRINCFRDFLLVTVLVTVDGNIEKSSLRGVVGYGSSPSFVGKEAGQARLVASVAWRPG